MQALIKREKSEGLWLEEVPEPEVGHDDVLIQVSKAGICGTDLHIYNWDDWASKTVPVPLVVGHEFVGKVVEVGPGVTDFRPGEIVRVISHSLEGYGEVVEEARPTGSKVRVLLEFMGRMVSAHIPWENLEQVDSETGEAHRRSRGTRGGGRWIQGMGPRATAQS